MSDEPLEGLAAQIARSGLSVPAAMLLDVISPFDVISSQLARFSRPFVGGTRAAPLVDALTETDAWARLRRLLDQR